MKMLQHEWSWKHGTWEELVLQYDYLCKKCLECATAWQRVCDWSTWWGVRGVCQWTQAYLQDNDDDILKLDSCVHWILCLRMAFKLFIISFLLRICRIGAQGASISPSRMFPLKKALAFVIFDESNLVKTGSGNQLIKLQLSAGLVLFLGLWKRLAWDRLRPAALSGAVRLPCRWELLSRCWAAFDLGISWLYHHWAAGEKCSFLCPTITWDGWHKLYWYPTGFPKEAGKSTLREVFEFLWTLLLYP